MRGKAMLATAVLGLLALTVGCSGADAVLDPQASPGGGTPPTTVEPGSENLGDDGASGHLGAR